MNGELAHRPAPRVNQARCAESLRSRSPLKRASLALFMLLAFLSGCAHVAGDDGRAQVIDAQTARRLHQRDWDLKGLTVEGRPIVIDVDTRITIRFAPGGQVSGFAAVNRYAGTYGLSADGKLSWGAVATVGRSAGAPELVEKEHAYLDGLARTNVAILAGHVLVLQSVDTSTVLTFSETGF